MRVRILLQNSLHIRSRSDSSNITHKPLHQQPQRRLPVTVVVRVVCGGVCLHYFCVADVLVVYCHYSCEVYVEVALLLLSHMQLNTHSLTHIHTHSFTCTIHNITLTHSLTHSLAHIHSHKQSLTHSHTHSLTHILTHLHVQYTIYHTLTNSLTHSLTFTTCSTFTHINRH